MIYVWEPLGHNLIEHLLKRCGQAWEHKCSNSPVRPEGFVIIGVGGSRIHPPIFI